MHSNLAVSGWRKLILTGQSFNDLKRSLVFQGKIDFVQKAEKYEQLIADYFTLFDSEISVENVRLEKIDLRNLPILELKLELGISESSFDLFQLNQDQFVNNLLTLSEELIYFHSDLEKYNCNTDSLNMIWEIWDHLNELVILFDPTLDI